MYKRINVCLIHPKVVLECYSIASSAIKMLHEYRVFGSSGSVGGRAPFARGVPEARTPRGVQGHAPPGKFVKLDTLKCNSLRFLDRHWVTGKVF